MHRSESDGDFDLDGDLLREECGVFGVFGHPDAATITALGLHALQHRGQEAAGIVTFDGKRFHSERRLGLVGDTFSRRDVIERLPGNMAVGHVRYSTTGETILRNVQDILWANLPLDDGLPDAATIYMLRAILQLPLVRTAIDGDDIAANFVLRSMRTILADETLPPCKLLSRLWQLEAETNGILGTATTSD